MLSLKHMLPGLPGLSLRRGKSLNFPFDLRLFAWLFRFYTVGSEKEQARIASALTNSAESTAKIGKFFYDTTRQLIASSSFTLVGKKTHGVDIVRDVLKLVPVHWAAADIVSSSLRIIHTSC